MKDRILPTISFLSRLLVLSVVVSSALVETCTAWTVFSIFLGKSASIFLSFAVFHFATSDAILVFETLCSQVGEFLSLSLEVTYSMLVFWLFLYGLVVYAAFYVFLPFSFMQHSFQLSLFMYVYLSKYYQIIPVLVNWLVMPSSLVVTLNVFNKVCSCLRDLILFLRQPKVSHLPAIQRAIDYFWLAVTYAICFFLTLSFSESVYISMHYGVSHYLIMSATAFSLSFAQEFLLLLLISLSTFKTMFSVSSAIVDGLRKPQILIQFALRLTQESIRDRCINLWGFFTLAVRAFTRGIQTATLGQGFKQVVVHTVDKGRTNAPAKIFIRSEILPHERGKEKQKKSSQDTDKKEYNWREELGRTLRSIRVV